VSDTPKRVRVPATHVVGASVQTTNAAEAQPSTARIGALWQKFFREDLASKVGPRAHPTQVLGVYTDYESDHTGEYTLVVGCPVPEFPCEPPDGLVAVTIPERDYLVFPAKGPMPQTLIATWGRIWDHFGRPPAPKRAFTTDFEVHDPTTPDEASIHIAFAEPWRQHVSSGSPYEPKIGFSRAVRVGPHVLVSGTAPIWPDGSCDPDPESQARRCFEIIVGALREAGAGPEHVVRTRMFITNPKDAEPVGKAHGAVFGEVRPSSTLVVVAALLDPRWKVEIEAEALVE
jgi:predicted transcriptional regulator YdeE